MAQLTDTQLRGLAIGKKRSERVHPIGSLLIWRRTTGSKEFYYRLRRKDKAEISVKLGSYPSLSLAKAREAAESMALKAQSGHDLKFLLAEEKRQTYEQEELQKRKREKEKSLGTLADLCRVYVGKLRSEGKTSWNKVESSLKRYVLDPFPELANRLACSITSDDIALVLSTMCEKGITTHTNRTRGDLHAAFNVGMHYDYSPAMKRKSGLHFDIDFNPVSRIQPVQNWERALSRFLKPEELRIVWHAIPLHMSPVYASLLRVMICTGFHPAELLRLKISNVRHEERAIYVSDTKNHVPNLVPLNRYAYDEVCSVINERDPTTDMFPSRVQHPKSDIYSRVSVLANQIASLRQNINDVQHFTARDIRRTVKTLMGKAGIPKDMRDRLQNHKLSDVSSKHYDRYDYWPEKQRAMKRWERWLTDNIVN